MIQQRPITLPPKFVRQLLEDFYGWSGELPDLTDSEKFFTTKAAQWGYEQGRAISEAELQKARDEELEACCKCVDDLFPSYFKNDGPASGRLRAASRPKPPSQAEEALIEIIGALELVKAELRCHLRRP